MADVDLIGALRARAAGLGFNAVGIARADAPWPAGARLEAFLAEGRHGEMGWMAETAARRAHPTAMWPAARSAIVVGLNYGPEADPLAALEATSTGAISVYARGSDYHDLIKGRLKVLAGWLQSATGADVKVFVDTAPLMEKPLAERSGVGWQGKHTNLVSRQLGSWLFLGVILTDHALEPDAPAADHCGSCRACLDICPTDAFPAPYQLDARRCLAYLTIEHAGPIPREYRAALGNRVFGCDDCLAVCPWNKWAAVTAEAKLAGRPETTAPGLADLASLDDAAFRARFAGSPIKRTGRDRFVRNVLIAIGNSGDCTLLPTALARLEDPSPIVRGAAVWAVWRLSPAEPFARLGAERRAVETDPAAGEEWRACLDATTPVAIGAT